MKVLLIAACSRSGCTIVESILGGYNDVFAGGELINLWQRGVIENRSCGCGDPFGSCAVWQPIVRNAFGELSARQAAEIRDNGAGISTVDVLTRKLPGRQPLLDPRFASYAQSLMALVRGVERSERPSLIIEAGSPTHIEVYSSMPDVDLRILHLVRDVRGVAYSTLRRKIYDPNDPTSAAMESFSPIRSGAIWAAQNLAFETYRAGNGRFRRLRYEDFTASPRAVLDDIARWCGLAVESSPFISEQQVRLGKNHIVSGNPSRFASGINDIVADDEWRQALPTRDRAILTGAFAPLLKRYGYPLRVGSR